MSVFSSVPYAQQGQARTPNFTGAAYNSARIQAMNQARKDKQKQQNIEGGVGLANSLREGGMLGGSVDAFKTGYAGAPTAAGAGQTMAPTAIEANLGQFAMNSAPVANTAGAGAFTLGGAEAASAAALAGTGTTATGAALGTGAAAGAGGGLAAGAGAALASNPVGWAAMAALAAYSLFG